MVGFYLFLGDIVYMYLPNSSTIGRMRDKVSF